jgi:hypothetical protein
MRLIYHCLQTPRSPDPPDQRRGNEHDPHWHGLPPALKQRNDRVWRVGRRYCYNKEKLEVEVRWEDALLESSEMRDGKSAVAEARNDEGLKLSFRSR